VVKVTQDLTQLFLVSFYRAASRRYVERFRKRGEVVRK
jgi:hypothetical protein